MSNFNSRSTFKSAQFSAFLDDPIILEGDVYESRYQNVRGDGTTNATPPFTIGSFGKTPDNRIFRYLRYSEQTTASTEGSLVVPAPSVTITTPTLASDGLSISGVALSPVIISAELVPQLYGSWVKLTWATTGKAAYRRIMDNNQSASAPVVYLDRAITAAEIGTGTLVVTVFRPYTVVASGATTDTVVGISIGAVTVSEVASSPDVDFYGWFQVKGVGPVNVNNATTAQGSGAGQTFGIVTPTATAGVGTLFPWTTPALADVYNPINFGFAHQIGGADIPANGRVLCNIDCTRNWF
jgi:hypothetical protein